MSSKILCGPCGYEDSIRNAKKWCTNCEEGFCEDCEKVHRSTKMSRNHTLISVSDFQKIKGVSISQTCVGHGEKYDLYCAFHDKPLCIDCVDQHKGCSQLVSLDKAAVNAKQSTALADLEDTINEALKNVGICIKNQEMISKKFDKQESLIKKNIQETREKLNQHLDILEQNLIQTLSTKTAVCKSEYGKMLNQLNLADQKLSQIKEDMETLKQMASNIQVFLGTCEINKTVSEEITSIKNMINSTKNFEIKIDIDSYVTSLLNRVDQLGILSVVERKSELQFKEAKLEQAQKHVSVPTGDDYRVLNLELKYLFKMDKAGYMMDVSDCLILPNGHILIADFKREKQIVEYNAQGQYVRYISCSGKPYYLTSIDPGRIAVTYLLSNIIEMIDLNSTSVQKIKAANECMQISYQNGKLYVAISQVGIVVFTLLGEILETLALDTKHVFNIAIGEGTMYYTNENHDTVHCLDSSGQEIWVYQNKSLVCPQGVVAKDDGVIVAGGASDNLFLIKQSGLESIILLTETDGLNQPRAVYYNKDRKELLVCNELNGNAGVYKL